MKIILNHKAFGKLLFIDNCALKIFLKMARFTVFCFFLGMLQVAAISSYSQLTRLSLNIRNESIESVLEKIEDDSEFFFLYNKDLIDLEQKVNINVKNETIKQILDELFKGKDIGYFVYEYQIVLSNKESIAKLPDQQNSVNGTVTDSRNQPLPGVTIVLKGTTQGVVTDLNGNYTFSDIPLNSTLQFSFIGMKTIEIQIGNQTTINVAMEDEIFGIEEVVAIGYGSVKKADLTGAVSSVAGKELAKNVVANPLFALQGKAAGVTITPASGQPGADVQVRIRGIQSINASNNPIYVIDGYISESMGSINNNDIESISILKDASSTAIYGSRAANGVVVITTKRGNKGAPAITFHSYYGVNTASNLKPEMLNSTDYLHLLEESYANSGQPVPNTAELINTYYRDSNGNIIDTDWLDVIMRNGSMQYYDLSVSGGSDKSNYFISANYLKEKGVVISQGQDRINFRFNSDHTINKFIKFGNTLNIFSHENSGLPDLSEQNYPNIPNPYYMALRKTPLTRPYEEDGSYGYTRYEGIEYRFHPPHLIANEFKRTGKYEGLTGNIFVAISPLSGLKITPKISLNRNFSQGFSFRPTVNLLGVEAINVNQISKSSSNSLHWQADFIAEYEKVFFENHNLKLLGVYSQEEFKSEYLSGMRNNTPLNSVTYLNAADPATATNANGFSDWSFISYLGRINYDFKRKYMMQATIRRDGSSRFSEENRWGVFPSFSAGWRVSEEKFFQRLTSVVNDLKFRASIGSVGNSNVGYYPTYASLGTTTYILGNEIVPGFFYQRAVNTDIQWETTKKKDFGFDSAILDSKLSLSINYFIANTTNLLFSKPLPPSAGKTGGLLVNGGEVENRGIEIDLGVRGGKGDFNYDVSMNFTRQRNEVIDLLGQDLTTSGLKVGYPLFSYYGFKSNGIIKTEADLAAAPKRNNLALGDIWLLDVGEQDGVITNEDRTLIGNRYPKFSYGLVSNFTYREISLSIQLQGIEGIDLPYTPGVYYMGNPENNRTLALERWHPTENPDGNMPKIQTSDKAGNFSNFSDFWLTDASYLRINNVMLSYNVPPKISNIVLLKNAQIYFSVQNLYTFNSSEFRGVEVDILTSSGYTGDTSTKMPFPRTWTTGLKITF